MTSESFDGWLVSWTAQAKAVPHGGPVAQLLAELAAGPAVLARTASVVEVPLYGAAAALRTPPDVLMTALTRLGEAGLLTCTYQGDADAPQVTITLLPPAGAPEPQPPPAADRPARSGAARVR